MLLRVVLVVVLAVMLSSCTSPEMGSLLNSGRDARVYNPVSGRYEWPEG